MRCFSFLSSPLTKVAIFSASIHFLSAEDDANVMQSFHSSRIRNLYTRSPAAPNLRLHPTQGSLADTGTLHSVGREFDITLSH